MVIESIKHFGVYLRGASFTVETDHKALEFLTKGSPKLMRWAALPQEDNCTVVYKPGETNQVADMLSRMHEQDEDNQNHSKQPNKILHQEAANSPKVGGDVVGGML